MNIFLFNIIFLFGCFSIGTLPCCTAKECTLLNIKHCTWDNQNLNTDCYFYKKIAKCLADIEECPTDELKAKLVEQKNRYEERVNYCPGLEDGICYHNKLSPCEKDVPWNVKYSENLPAAEKQLECSKFKGKADSAKKCMKDVKSDCTAEHIHKRIDSSIAGVEQIEKLCGF